MTTSIMILHVCSFVHVFTKSVTVSALGISSKLDTIRWIQTLRQSRQLDEDSVAGIISTRRQAAAEAERRRGEDAEDVSSAHMADPLSQVCPLPVASCLQPDTPLKFTNHFPACFAYIPFVCHTYTECYSTSASVLLQTPTISACIGHYTRTTDAAIEAGCVAGTASDGANLCG